MTWIDFVAVFHSVSRFVAVFDSVSQFVEVLDSVSQFVAVFDSVSQFVQRVATMTEVLILTELHGDVLCNRG